MINKLLILVLLVTVLLCLNVFLYQVDFNLQINRISELIKADVTPHHEPVTFKDLPKSLQESGTVPYRNLLEETMPPFLPNYRNPCWWEKRGSKRHLNCLPYVYLIGMSKCGSSDLSAALFHHPYILPIGEYHWWSKHRRYMKQGVLQGKSLRFYTLKFEKNIQQLEAISIPDGVHADDYHPALLIDRSPSIIYWNEMWDQTPENSGRSIEEGPLYHNAHYIHHVTPQAKIIVTLRNPTNRFYSWFLIRAPQASKEDFHEGAHESIRLMTICIEQRSLWSCVNNRTITASVPASTQFRSCIYYPFVKAWLDVFPRQQMYFSRMEDYSRNRTKRVNEIVKFLELDLLTNEKSETLSNMAIKNNKSTIHKKKGPMLPQTRMMLDDFFQPFNKKLAILLQDKIWLFQDT